MRKSYVVCYDIADDKRLTRIRETVRDYGVMLQFSVYHCELGDVDLARLKSALSDQINSNEDKILFINLGPLKKSGDLSHRIETLGQKPTLPDTKKLIF